MIVTWDQLSDRCADEVSVGWYNSNLSGVVISIHRADRFGQMLLHRDEARALLAGLKTMFPDEVNAHENT